MRPRPRHRCKTRRRTRGQAPPAMPLGVAHRNRAPRLRGERRDSAIAKAARIDQPVVVESVQHVERHDRASRPSVEPQARWRRADFGRSKRRRARSSVRRRRQNARRTRSRRFPMPNQRHDFPEPFEPANRVDDQLPGPVIRHVAAALDRDTLDAAPCKCFVRKQYVLTFRLPAERNHRQMLDDDPRVGRAPLAHGLVQPVLEIPNFAIASTQGRAASPYLTHALTFGHRLLRV